MIKKIAFILFFLVFGIAEFIRFTYADLILGVLALVIAVAAIVKTSTE